MLINKHYSCFDMWYLKRLILVAALVLCDQSATASDIVFAGISFVGDYDQQSSRYPHAAQLLKEKLPNGQAVLESQLRKVLEEEYIGPLDLLDSASGKNDGPQQALAFALSAEGIEEIHWGNGYLYIYRVLASILVFDFEKQLLIANYPAMVQFQDASVEQRSTAQHLEIFKTIYSSQDPDRSIFHEWVDHLEEVELKQSFPMYLGVRSVTLQDGLPAQLPTHMTASAYETAVAQVFETILSKEHDVSMVPYSSGQAVGQAMPLSFQDARVFQLQLPEPNFVFDLSIEPFKHLEKKKGKGLQHAFGAFMTLDFSLAATDKKYVSSRFKQVNTSVFNQKESVELDIWQAQQTALRGLMANLARQIRERDKDKLATLTKDSVADQFKQVEEKLSLCK